MSKRHVAVGASLLGLVAAGALSLGQGSASADIAPQAQDIVGVGSDVIQNSVNFLSDGSPLGDPGYNSVGNLHRVFDFDASPDANGRAAFSDPSLASGALTGTTVTSGSGASAKTTGTGVPLRAAAVLAAGQSPQERPNGGGAGVAAIEADTGDNIDFVRSPNALTATDESNAQGTIGTHLDAIQFADDSQYIATSAQTNAPAGLTAEDVAAIYCKNFTPSSGDYYATNGFGSTKHVTDWSQIPGSTTSGTILPLRPQDGAGVLTTFSAALSTYATDGCTGASAWNSNVVQVQQNDPTTITGATDPNNAIVPFPLSRFKLLANKYYADTSDPSWTAKNAFPANVDGKAKTPLLASGIRLQIPQGKPGDTAGNQLEAGSFTEAKAGSFYKDLPFYIVFRDSDATSTKTWQPGSSLNWVETLFYNPDYKVTNPAASTAPAPFFASAAGQQLISNLGLTPSYQYFDWSSIH